VRPERIYVSRLVGREHYPLPAHYEDEHEIAAAREAALADKGSHAR
jgi:hypothetical protein